MIKEQLTTDAALRTNNWGFFALRKIPVNCTQSRGAVLLIAILVASVALAVGLGVYNRTYKELLFASYWKQTQVGFSAADAGLECAMYNDTHPTAAGIFPSGSGGGTSPFSFSCFGNNITGALETGSPSGGVATSTFSAQVANGCVNVTVVKSGSAGPYPLTFVATTTVGATAGLPKVAISPDGSSVYATNAADRFVYQYNRATTTGNFGNLSPMTPPYVDLSSVSCGLSEVAISYDGKSVYVTDYCGSKIFQFNRDITNGTLSPMTPDSFLLPTANFNPAGIAISPDNTSVYVTSQNTQSVLQYDRNNILGPSLGLLTYKTSYVTGLAASNGLAISPDSKSVYVEGSPTIGPSLLQYARDTTTGNLNALSPKGVDGGAWSFFDSIAVSPDGRSVYKTNNGSAVYQYSRNTNLGTSFGALTPLSPSFTFTDSSWGTQGIVISPESSSVYVANAGGYYDIPLTTVSQFSRDATGHLSLMNPSSTSTNLSGVIPNGGSYSDTTGIVISLDGKSVYVTNDSEGLIYQFSTGAGDSPVSTLINARGYNTPYNTLSFDCANTSPRRVERGLRVEY